MAELQVLIENQRDSLVTVKILLQRFLAKRDSEKSRGYIEALTLELDNLFHMFKHQHDEIVKIIRETSLNISDVPYMVDECFFEYLELYFSFKGKLIESLPSDATRSPISSTFAMPTGHADITAIMDARLPKISLPKFSGEYIDWIPFRDIYLSLVHTNTSLSTIQKFYYLKGTLIGEAAALIKAISATEANYASAWNILETRYHNKRAIVSTLIQRLFKIPKSDGSFQSIRSILDTTQECISSLGNLEIDTSAWDPILVFLLCQKLDLQTRREWEHSLRSSTEVPSCSEMFSFLERTFRSLESLNETVSATNKYCQKNNVKTKQKSYVHNGNIKSKSPSCLFCEKTHYLSQCYKFLALPVKSKNEFLVKRKICRNCLYADHSHDNCNSLNRCGICKQPHHTILHVEERISVQNSNIVHSTLDGSEHLLNEQVANHNFNNSHNVLLYTIRLFVNSGTDIYPLRALLDPGSQGTLISEAAVQLLRLPKRKTHCRVIGVGTGCESTSKYSVEIELLSREKRRILNCNALVLSNISSYKPNYSSNKISVPKLETVELADPYYYRTDPIDIILGSDVCCKIKIPTESFVHNDLFFQNTLFGWVFSGPSEPTASNHIVIHNVNLESLLRSFWEQEEVTAERDLSNEELACENYFKATTRRDSYGRYIVHLPFRSVLLSGITPGMHNNMIGALKRFKQLEIAFSKNSEFSDNYKSFMHEYESLKHMSKIGTYPGSVEENCYFLPHHGVVKESSSTTKLRVVFDGSSHIQGRKSLNEELLPGPALQNELPKILNKWRLHKIAFSADIEKMFRQIQVAPEHRKYQQILWRYNLLDEICVYQLNTVTYGTTSAPFLSIRVLHQLATEYEVDFPNESKILISDSYVDDIISGADSLSTAISLQRNLCSLLAKSGCNLRKWISNSPEFLREIPEENRENSLTFKFDRDNIVKTLGIQWNTTTDSFSFNVNIDQSRSSSKRSMLSDTARLYDPLGLLTPSTVIAKMLIKQLWERGIDWDDKIPSEIEQTWLKYRSTLINFMNLRIPRWIRFCSGSKLELHCFCDASTVAYAAAVYARVITFSHVSVNLLQAKSKISPVKTVSIPRLELCAASLLVKLSKKVKDSFSHVSIDGIFFWSDSSTVLSWIRKPPSTWTVYVANRVAEIQRISNPIQWKYVPSNLNPVDCASRGIFPNELMEYNTWWYGPKFLLEPPSAWPGPLSIFDTSQEKRKSKTQICVLNTFTSGPERRESGYMQYPSFLYKFSKMKTLLRVMSLCYRFVHNSKISMINKDLRETTPLNVVTINMTLTNLIKITQTIDFSSDIKQQIISGNIKQKSLLKLLPYISADDLIRVGGRLHNSTLPYCIKHPIILAKTNPLSKLLIREAHESTLHGGITLTMSYVNRKYWIVSGNQLAKNLIRNCINCFKYSAKTANQIMGNLPPVRLNVTRPFKHSGVDYAGPISVKNSTFRSAITSKGYICLFICMVTKAIHLELVSDLTTNSFLAAFRRFISRRGNCTDIYSDCGTNFIGASKELRVLSYRNEKSIPADLRDSLVSVGTEWHFIPPASPNFGGLWEAGVKSVKHHLKRVMKDRILTFEELSTLLTQIECCLNSRPLCPLSSDPSDLDALTPAHFLIGEPTNCIQEENLLELNIDRLSRWKSIEKLKQHFWKRWYLEYLNRMQARPKWLQCRPNAQIGDLVIIADNRCGPGQWLMGRVCEVHPGQDGRVRVVSIRTKDKTIKRPITKICFLPTDSNSNVSTPQYEATIPKERMELDADAVSRSIAKSND